MPQKNQIGTRLAEWGRLKYGGDRGWQARFSEALDVPSSTLRAYLSGTVRPGNEMQAKLRALGCDIEWLMTGERREEGVYRQAEIPLLGKIVADPDGKEYFEDAPEGTMIPYFPGNYFALVIEGDSLINAPEGEHSFEIYPGDICIFQVGPQPKNGDIVAVQLKQSNKRMVKILRHLSRDEIELQSANKFRNYPSMKQKKSQIASFGILVGKTKLAQSELKKIGLAK